MRAFRISSDFARRWAIELAPAAFAVTQQWSVRPWVGNKITFRLFLPVIVVAAARSGRAAGLFVIAGGMGIEASAGFAPQAVARLIQTRGLDGACAMCCTSRQRTVIADTESDEVDAGLRVLASEETRPPRRLSTEVRHMAPLLDDLLDVSRITRGRLALRRAPTCWPT